MTQYLLNSRHASQHRWFYFPKMTKEEMVLFKMFDSDTSKEGRSCFHSAFSDPLVGGGVPCVGGGVAAVESCQALCGGSRARGRQHTRNNQAPQTQSKSWIVALSLRLADHCFRHQKIRQHRC